MKTDPPDSPNVPDAEDGGDDVEALRDLVLTTRSGSPTDDAVQRIAKRLVAAGALESGSLAETARAGASATTRIAGKIGYYKVGAIALALVAGSLLAWRATWTSAEGPLPPRISASPPVATVGAPAGGPSEPKGSTGAVAMNPAPDGKEPAAPTISIDALPSAAPTTHATASRATLEEPSANTAAAEHLLVRRAQDALAADPARALSIANEHVRVFPSGELTQEREVVAVEALSRLGRKDEALLRATALLRRFPRTPYVAHLEKALGRPLPTHRNDAASSPTNPNP